MSEFLEGTLFGIVWTKHCGVAWDVTHVLIFSSIWWLVSCHLICSSEYPVSVTSASTSAGESSVLTKRCFFDDFLRGNISGLYGGKSCKMSSRILVFMTVLWFFGYNYFENIFTIFILAFEDQVRILLCVCLHHFLKNITPIFDNNCVLYCLYIFGNYVYCFCTHRRLKNTCSTRTFNINHYKAYFYCVNHEQLVALVNVLNKT